MRLKKDKKIKLKIRNNKMKITFKLFNVIQLVILPYNLTKEKIEKLKKLISLLTINNKDTAINNFPIQFVNLNIIVAIHLGTLHKMVEAEMEVGLQNRLL